MGTETFLRVLSQNSVLERSSNVNASSVSEAVADPPAHTARFDLEAVFCAQFPRIARAIARVVRDHGRAEELAVEAFVKLLRHPRLHNGEANVEAWLYRTAIRLGLDELRRQVRRSRFEQWLRFARPAPAPSPEEIHVAGQEQQRVRGVLGVMPPRQAELLLLRSQDLTYNEIASAMNIHPASLGKLLARAQQSFRKEYIQRYGPK